MSEEFELSRYEYERKKQKPKKKKSSRESGDRDPERLYPLPGKKIKKRGLPLKQTGGGANEFPGDFNMVNFRFGFFKDSSLGWLTAKK